MVAFNIESPLYKAFIEPLAKTVVGKLASGDDMQATAKSARKLLTELSQAVDSQREFNAFLDGFKDTADSLYRQNAHPAAAGNISSVIDESIIPDEVKNQKASNSNKFDNPIPGLESLHGKYVLITATNERLGNVKKHPEKAAGIIKIVDNETYEKIWGFEKPDSKPTSEVDTHLRILSKLVQANDDPHYMPAIIHSHPEATIAMMYAGHVVDDASANKAVWQGSTEGSVYVRNGIKYLPWRESGTPEIGDETASAFAGPEGKKHDAVLWGRHGIMVAGDNLEAALNKLEAIDHSMKTTLQAYSAKDPNKDVNWLDTEQLSRQVNRFEDCALKNTDLVKLLFDNGVKDLIPKRGHQSTGIVRDDMVALGKEKLHDFLTRRYTGVYPF